MSTLAAARADNFYYPPEWDPTKGGLNKQQGQHPLRERAKKLDQGILVIRFEMPFNVWCSGCGHLIGKGVRFNAEKKAVGNYHSTKIWSFTMSAPCCKQRIEVQTDPKNTEYVVVSGAKRKVESWSAADIGSLEFPEAEERARLDDPFSKLEAGGADKRRAWEAAEQLAELREDRDAKARDDYTANKELRKRMRGRRKEEKALDAQRAALGLPEAVPLLPASAADAHVAALVPFDTRSGFTKAWQHRRRDIQTASIFGNSLPSAQAASALPAGMPGKAGTGASGIVSGGSNGMQRRASAGAGAGAGQRAGPLDRLQLLAKRKRLELGVRLGVSEPVLRKR